MQIETKDEYRHLGAFYDEAGRLAQDWPDDRLFGVQAGISGWSPAQHLFHLAKANGSMLKAIHFISLDRPPVSHDGGPNEHGRAVLTTGQMKRGQAQAPVPVVPPDTPDREALRAALERSGERYRSVATLVPHLDTYLGRLPHPFLGQLNAEEWLRITRIHSVHHLAIIHEIAAAHRHSG